MTRFEPTRPIRPDRLNALSDAVFAIAMTLLALDVRVPADVRDHPDFLRALPTFLTQLAVYALGFFIIAQYWLSHHRVMRYVTEIDHRAMVRTIAVLAGVAALPIATSLIGHEARFPEATAIAAAMLALTSLLNSWLNLWLLRPGLSEIDPAVRARMLARGPVTAGLFALAIPLAYLLPDSSYAPLVWWSLVATGPITTGVLRVTARLRSRPA